LKSHNKKKGSIGKRLLSFFHIQIVTIMLKKLINKILLGNTQIAGMRTIILNTIILLIGIWDFAIKDGGLFQFLCGVGETFPVMSFFCNISETAFYSSALVVVTALNNVLRWLSDTPVGSAGGPARLTVGSYSVTPGRKAFISIAVGLSVGVLLILIVKGLI
jgi:hypothetical protein